MYKALIIDDEEPARRAIKALGAWEQYQVVTLLEAENGKKGLALLAEHQPDLVFVDMKMPLLGGEAFLEAAKPILPLAKYIVISGYNDFHFARSAIQAGALDYLLKPIKKKELNEIIQKAMEQLDLERNQQSVERSSIILHNISLPLVKEKIFSSIIDQNGRFHQIRELEALLEAEPGSSFQVITMKVLNIWDISKNRFAGDRHALYFALTNALNELLATLGKAFSFKSSKDDQEIVIVLSWPPLTNHSQLAERMEAVLGQIDEVFNVKCIAAIGTSADSIEHLDASYQSAKATLVQVNMLDEKAVYLPEILPAEKRTSIMEQRDLLFHAVESKSSLYATNYIRDFFAGVEQSGYFSMDYMSKTGAELRLLLEQVLKKFQALPSEVSEALGSYDKLFADQIMSFAAFKVKVIDFFEHFFDTLCQSLKPKEKIQVDAIKEYIDHHYYEDISIAYFTDKYFVSKEHLLRLFKQKYGCGIYEYTLIIRMEKAKQLLADPGMKIQTVSEKVGYHDTNYFSKAFKKHCGVSPQEYRLSL